jgi:3-methyladenine DNA glycosylase/8-oxoguanine DNA glycosylase
MEIFEYGHAEIEYLKRRDKKLGAVIDRLGIIEREISPNPFCALVMSIVSQQISGKAADTIWRRLSDKFPEVTPDSIVNADISDIQKCGLSMRKARYVKGIGAAVMCGDIDFSRFHEMPDDEIIEELSSLHGIGVWTAEMFLIFSLRRPDVVSWGDLAIRRGMMNLYGLRKLTKVQFERYRKKYSPYGSIASLYLWALSAI